MKAQLANRPLTRETLADANCCRFCGYGVHESVDVTHFVSIYDKMFKETDDPNSDGTEFTLDRAINKYLPLQVSSKELYYPKVICINCLDTLNMTIKFFQAIAKGQKLLTKIINSSSKTTTTTTTASVEEDREKENNNGNELGLQFSKDNPIFLPPKKKRGRPRKNETSDNATSSNSTKKSALLQTEYNVESKPKRQTKRPLRYSDAVIPNLNNSSLTTDGEQEHCDKIVIVNDSNTNGNLCNNNSSQHINSECEFTSCDESKPSSAICQTTNNSSLLMTNGEDLMDLTRFTVIMDDDVEISHEPADKQHAPHLVPGSESEPSQSSKANDSIEYDEKNDDSSQTIKVIVSKDKSMKNKSTSKAKTTGKKGKRRGAKKKELAKQKRKDPTLKPSKTPLLQCEICQRQFTHPSSFSWHKATAHDKEKRFVCSVPTCRKAFSHKQLLDTHSSVHSVVRQYKCEVKGCSAAFKTKASLYTHNKSIHRQTRFTCEICGLMLTLKSSLISHLRLHKGELGKEHTCDFCQKKFFQKNNMLEHRRIHTGERPFKCECGKSFTTASQLRTHNATHLPKNSLAGPISKQHQRSTQVKQKVVDHPLTMGVDSISQMEPRIEHVDMAQNIEGSENLNTDSSENYVHVLNTENLGHSLSDEASHVLSDQQVIYLYPDDLSYYTLVVAETADQENETHQNQLQTQALIEGPMAFVASESTLDNEHNVSLISTSNAQYFQLQGRSSDIQVPNISDDNLTLISISPSNDRDSSRSSQIVVLKNNPV